MTIILIGVIIFLSLVIVPILLIKLSKINSSNFKEVDKLKQDIINLYREIGKYKYGQNFPKIKRLLSEGREGTCRTVIGQLNEYNIIFNKNKDDENKWGITFLSRDAKMPLFGFNIIDETTPLYDIKLK